jgi:predicted RNA-binding protein with RPS1 domain
VTDNRRVEDVAQEGALVDVKVMEVDPIHHKIVLAATSQPREAPPKPASEAAPAPADASDAVDAAEEPPAAPEE